MAVVSCQNFPIYVPKPQIICSSAGILFIADALPIDIPSIYRLPLDSFDFMTLGTPRFRQRYHTEDHCDFFRSCDFTDDTDQMQVSLCARFRGQFHDCSSKRNKCFRSGRIIPHFVSVIAGNTEAFAASVTAGLQRMKTDSSWKMNSAFLKRGAL